MKTKRKSTPQHKRSARQRNANLYGPPVDVWPVTDVTTPEELLRHCMPAFGAAYVRRIYNILDQIVGKGIPLIVAVAGPVTVSNQHRSWLNPLLDAGWVAYLTTTDAACYHDGHRSLEAFNEHCIREVAIEGKDEAYRKSKIIRVTDTGFDEKVLFNQDQFVTTLLRRPEFQRSMTGPEFRNLLGKYYDAQERAFKVEPGLLATCYKNAIPVFVGAPGDGSVYLNHVKLWALAQRGVIKHQFEIDVAGEVFESCAYHYWGLKESRAKQLGILILGGGVPKNFSLQPEPTLGQIFLLDRISGYDYDVQIVGAPVTDGSLTSCKPAEAHTWGKVSLEALRSTTESFQADYSTLMPLIVWALMEKRKRFEASFAQKGARLFRRHPEAKGYLGHLGHYRLFEQRRRLVGALLDAVTSTKQAARIAKTWDFPLQYSPKNS